MIAPRDPPAARRTQHGPRARPSILPAMHPTQEPRPRARSSFAAAFLSLIFPGLGHAYAGTWDRALGFAAAPLLGISLLAGLALNLRLVLLGFVIANLPLILILDVLVLGYRVVAAVDAYRVAAYLN